jgi:hypothetical protein
MHYASWLDLLRRAHGALAKFAPPHRETELRVNPPAPLAKLRQVQQSMPERIPESLSRVLLEFSESAYLFWLVDESRLSLPSALRSVYYGQCELELDAIPHLCRDWFVPENLVRSPEHGGRCDFDYTSLFPFMVVDNGDMLLLVRTGEHAGKVVYFAHDNGSLPILAQSLDAFLEPWFELGCPGPDLYCLSPFLDSETGQLSSTSENAVTWKKTAELV